MTAIRVAIGMLWLLSLLAGRGVWNPAVTSPIAATSAEITDQFIVPTQSGRGAAPVEEEPQSCPRVDLFGNEIEEALADYRIDVRGSVYERHSPETALATLGSPST
jgi:hypothetical protein